MNILIPDSWLREYLDTDAKPTDIQRCLSLCGPSIERMNKIGDDYIYDIEVTTNRVDCMSVYGIAREAAAILPEFGYQSSLKTPKLLKLPLGNIPNLIISNDPKLNHRVIAIQVENLPIIPSPTWLTQKLEKVGQRPLNNLVDITNYVMWEVGHPCHVFDFAKVSSEMVFREAKKGETVVTLDKQTHQMLGGEVVIVNQHNQIIDLPSIMGTDNSVVSENTQKALLFIDDVVSHKVRFASMSHAIRTNAATLLEKDVDPESSMLAMSRMVEIIKSLYPKAKFSPLLDIYPNPIKPNSFPIQYNKISELIGINISKERINNILKRLNFKLTGNTVTPPSYRIKDINIQEDLVEEVARIYGYHNIPSILMTGELPNISSNQNFSFEQNLKTALKYLGFTETYTYSLTDQTAPLKLSNPLSSDWVYMRNNLIYSHINTINQNRGFSDELSFFEIANVYLPTEELRLIVSSNTKDFDCFKGKIEAFLSDQNILLDPEIQTVHDIFYWEIPISELLKHHKSHKTYSPISKFMPIVEDFNIILNSPYQELENKIKTISPLINQIQLIDKYQNKLTLRLTFHDPARQLTKDDITDLRQKISNLH